MQRAAERRLLQAPGAQGVPRFRRRAQAVREAAVAVQLEQTVRGADSVEEVAPVWKCSD
jgi:hypothetical protein